MMTNEEKVLKELENKEELDIIRIRAITRLSKKLARDLMSNLIVKGLIKINDYGVFSKKEK